MFDTLTYAKKLKEAGVPERQAEVQAETLSEIIGERLVTKEHLDLRIAELKHEINLLKWMMGVVIAGILSLVLKAFFVA